MINDEVQAELRRKYNPDGSTLRKAQLKMSEMLSFVDKICVDNDIEYWIDGGTLLGARRHNGFIPWDDDVDICMTAPNFRRFKSIMGKDVTKEGYILHDDDTDPNFYCVWAVLRDVNSEYIQDSKLHNMRKYRGLQIDIFIMDDHTNMLLWKFSRKWMNKLVLDPIFGIGRFKQLNKILHPIVHFNYWFFKHILSPFINLISFRTYDYYKYPCGCNFEGIDVKTDIYPIKRTAFEGLIVNCPHDIDSYLTRMYGEWQLLPSQIETHEVTVVFKS